MNNNSAWDDTISDLVCTYAVMFFFNAANTNTQYLCMAGAGSALAVSIYIAYFHLCTLMREFTVKKRL